MPAAGDPGAAAAAPPPPEPPRLDGTLGKLGTLGLELGTTGPSSPVFGSSGGGKASSFTVTLRQQQASAHKKPAFLIFALTGAIIVHPPRHE
jgi:hypothetical protein